MPSNENTSAIVSAGMFLLKEKLGVLDAETFIAAIRNDHFDYTEWRKENLFAGMTAEEIHNAAVEYAKTHQRPPLRDEK
jgi:hypothetical protein